MARNSGKSQSDTTGESAEPRPVFEQALMELEKIVAELESGQLSLTESIRRYEQGVRMLRQCHTALGDADQKIQLLTRVDEDGKATTVPFETTTAQPGSRGSAKSKPSMKPEPPDESDDESGGRLF
jgi:exodeoxyribonuclease VII small subunit